MTLSTPKQHRHLAFAADFVGQTVHHRVVIVGGGAAGIAAAAQLMGRDRSLDVALVEPSQCHHYQPGWTLVGGGLAPVEAFTKDEASVIPAGVTWLQDAVTQFDPDHNTLMTVRGLRVEYDYLILTPGIQIDWDKIAGLKEALGKNGVTSNYSRHYAPYTWEAIQNFKGGNALFTYPNTPIKCGGAPQKVMYMADDHFKSKSGVGVNTTVMFCTAGAKLFGAPAYNATLEKVVERRGIIPKFHHNLVEIRGDRQEAVFEVTQGDRVSQVVIPYNFIHVAPPMSAPDFIKNSPLANGAGWVDVDKHTLQHLRYPNIFSAGDASSLPTSKTAPAARKQVPVLVDNLRALMVGKPLAATYNGYTCCPLITGYHSAIMAEFDYDNNPVPSFPLDPTKERYSMFLAKAYVMPWIYWNRMLKGTAFEADMLKPLNRLLGY